MERRRGRVNGGKGSALVRGEKWRVGRQKKEKSKEKEQIKRQCVYLSFEW